MATHITGPHCYCRCEEQVRIYDKRVWEYKKTQGEIACMAVGSGANYSTTTDGSFGQRIELSPLAIYSTRRNN
jgi:hypothetical protein